MNEQTNDVLPSENTIICLKYRDGHGDGYHDYTVVNGLITQEQINTIHENLIEEQECIIANQVGLESPARHAFMSNGGITDKDHVYTILNDFANGFKPNPERMSTTECAHTTMTINELVNKIKETDFCEQKELDRINGIHWG